MEPTVCADIQVEICTCSFVKSLAEHLYWGVTGVQMTLKAMGLAEISWAVRVDGREIGALQFGNLGRRGTSKGD